MPSAHPLYKHGKGKAEEESPWWEGAEQRAGVIDPNPIDTFIPRRVTPSHPVTRWNSRRWKKDIRRRRYIVWKCGPLNFLNPQKVRGPWLIIKVRSGGDLNATPSLIWYKMYNSTKCQRQLIFCFRKAYEIAEILCLKKGGIKMPSDFYYAILKLFVNQISKTLAVLSILNSN